MFDLNFIKIYLKAIYHLINGSKIIFHNRQQYLLTRDEPSYHTYRSVEIMKILKNDIVCLNRYIHNEFLQYFDIKAKELTSPFIQQYATAIKGH